MNKLIDFKNGTSVEDINKYAEKHKLNPISIAVDGNYNIIILFEPVIKYVGD